MRVSLKRDLTFPWNQLNPWEMGPLGLTSSTKSQPPPEFPHSKPMSVCSLKARAETLKQQFQSVFSDGKTYSRDDFDQRCKMEKKDPPELETIRIYYYTGRGETTPCRSRPKERVALMESVQEYCQSSPVTQWDSPHTDHHLSLVSDIHHNREEEWWVGTVK